MEIYHHPLFLKTLLLLENISQVFSKYVLSISKALSCTASLSAHLSCLGHLTHYSMGESSFLSGEWGEEPGRIQKQPVSCPVLVAVFSDRNAETRSKGAHPRKGRARSLPQGRRQETLQSQPQNRIQKEEKWTEGGRLGWSPTVTEEEHRH